MNINMKDFVKIYSTSENQKCDIILIESSIDMCGTVVIDTRILSGLYLPFHCPILESKTIIISGLSQNDLVIAEHEDIHGNNIINSNAPRLMGNNFNASIEILI